MVRQLTRISFLLALAAFAFTSCASSKRKEDQSALAKLWHNMNSHYNGYFNAQELMDESLLVLEEQHVDNYTQRLKMFPFLEVTNPSIVGDNLDVAVEKVAIVVKKHPYSNWVDDSYLLVGQAQLIKQDYESAEKTLRFMTNEFRPRPKRKKAKKRKKGDPEEEDEEEVFDSRREVEKDPTQDRRDRIRAREEAQKERKKLQKEREKENKTKQKQREKERKARIRARKKGIKLAPIKRDTTSNQGLENEPEEVEEEEDLGPVGMISIFGGANRDAAEGGAFGKKGPSYAVKHRPAYQEGRLWLAWTFIKRDNFDRAQVILEELRNDRATFTDVRRRAMAVQAFNYLEQERLDEAIPFLEEAAEVALTRNEKARFYYIAGQLHQELKNPGGAQAAFEEAIAARPDYKLELGARLNLAQNSFLSGSGSASEAIARLEKMAKEDKNLDYQAEIYFSAATVALKDGNRALGGQYLRRALDSPNGGAGQRQEAYKLLGDIAYDDSDYYSAKFAYDTTLQVMGRNDERYPGVNERRDQLTGIAQNISDITRGDSLLRIGMMPEPERAKWAQNLFQSQRAAIVAASTGPAVNSATGSAVATTPSNSTFFAYNTSTMRRGRKDFERRWGDRPLTDNWRLGSRGNTDIFDDEDDRFTTTNENVMATEDEINALLDGIPVTEAAQATARIQLANNYFSLGREYRDRLGNSEMALEAFADLETKFPSSANEAEAWYYQYLINQELGRTAEAGRYAQKLRDKYANSKFERLANDPTYAKRLLDSENEFVIEYEKALKAFDAGNYQQAAKLAAAGKDKLKGKHPLKARYDLLQAMTKGSTEGKQAYIDGLQQVVADYPNSPEQTRAKEILRLLGATGARIPGKTGAAGSRGFKESFDELHYLLVIFDGTDVDLNQAKISVAEYNNKYNKLDRIRITNVYLGSDVKVPVLILRRFKSGEKAMDYLGGAREKEQEFLDAGKFSYDLFAVSQSNYRELLKQRSAEEYREWYPQNY